MEEVHRPRTDAQFGGVSAHDGDIDRASPMRAGNFWWLVAAPTCFAFGAWLVPGARHSADGLLLPSMIAISGFTPLAGLLIVVVYVWRTRDWKQLPPYAPFAVVAVFFAVSMVALATTMPGDESQNAMIPVFQVFSGFAQPWLALAGGLMSFSAARRRRMP